MYYYSYGSNMSIRRLVARLPSARRVTVAHLEKHVLNFHKIGSKDGSAKCDATHTGKAEDIVIGVVYEISEEEKKRLDGIEGRGYGYEHKMVSVITIEGNPIEAVTYYATRIDPSLKPFHWYKEHVVRGAKENDLPMAYIEVLESVESIADPKPKRHRLEMAMYR